MIAVTLRTPIRAAAVGFDAVAEVERTAAGMRRIIDRKAALCRWVVR